MPDDQSLSAPQESTSSRRVGWRRGWIGIVIATVLLTAAIVVAARQHSTIGQALAALQHPSAGHLCLLLGAIAANVILTGLMFGLLISRYGKVGRMEMQALIAAATLLNFIPLRPGLFGRIAYHRTFNAIPAVDSVKTVVQAMIITTMVAGYLATALVIASTLAVQLWLAMALPMPLLALVAVRRSTRIWAAAAMIRYLEVLVWAVRYHAAFALIGSPISYEHALAFACLSMITMLVPLFGNGLGLREWAIGLAAPILLGGDTIIALGITADLLNRAAELLVVLILGLTGITWLTLRRRRQTS